MSFTRKVKLLITHSGSQDRGLNLMHRAKQNPGKLELNVEQQFFSGLHTISHARDRLLGVWGVLN